MVSIDTTVTLHNGVKMPVFGLGLYRTKSGKEAQNAVQWAWDAGYRMFDTAQIYGNEHDVGIALAELPAERSEYFVTTKLWRANFGDKAKASFEASLAKLQLDYVDLFLLHWPVKGSRLQSWDKLVDLVDEGKVKSIGVSNFMVWHLEELANHSDIQPTVNQIELSPYLNPKDLLNYCQDRNIIVEGYSPLTKGRKLSDPKLVQLAEKYDKTPAQVLIRWCLEKNTIVIPKSSKQHRIVENSQVFDFSIDEEDMASMEAWHEQLVTGWDPYQQD